MISTFFDGGFSSKAVMPITGMEKLVRLGGVSLLFAGPPACVPTREWRTESGAADQITHCTTKFLTPDYTLDYRELPSLRGPLSEKNREVSGENSRRRLSRRCGHRINPQN